MKRTILLLLAAAAAAACATKGPSPVESDFYGTWVKPVSGMPGTFEGFVLHGGDSASSVNTATLVYDRWKLDGDRLILRGRSIGNGQTIRFTDTLRVVRFTPDTLVVGDGAYQTTYVRGGGGGENR